MVSKSTEELRSRVRGRGFFSAHSVPCTRAWPVSCCFFPSYSVYLGFSIPSCNWVCRSSTQELQPRCRIGFAIRRLQSQLIGNTERIYTDLIQYLYPGLSYRLFEVWLSIKHDIECSCSFTFYCYFISSIWRPSRWGHGIWTLAIPL